MFALVVPTPPLALLVSNACSPKKRGAANRQISTSGHSGSLVGCVT
jgi:hypothetical protein